MLCPSSEYILYMSTRLLWAGQMFEDMDDDCIHKEKKHDVCRSYVNTYHNTNLVGGFNPLKNISQVEVLFPIYGKS